MALARARRQVEVFDIAIVAVVTKALGAFIVLVIMLLPYYRSDPANAPAVQAVRDHLRDARLAVESARQALNERSSDPTALANLIERAKESIAEAQGFVQAMRNSLDQASAQIGRLEAREKDLEQQIGRFQAELGQAREQADRLQADKTALEQANRTLSAESASLRAADEVLKRDNQDLRARNSNMERQIADAADLRSQNESLQREATNLRQQNETMTRQSSDLNQQIENLQKRAVKTVDPSLVMRWFSVGLAISECSDLDLSLYVRWDGPLRNAQTGADMPEAKEFSAARPEERTPLLGHRYFDLGAKSDAGSLSDSALQREGFVALGKTQTQIKVFQAVSRAEGDYSVYVAAKDPQAFRQRKCAVVPYYLSWTGATLGQKIVLSQKQPFAWLRRFRINKDGTNTLGMAPKDDEEFQRDLEKFSKAQSEGLCRERKLCGTEDAHRFALQTPQRNPRAAPQ